jgi:HEAT repeat protein
MPARLEPASHAHAHAQLADVVVAMLEDEDDRVRERALATLGKQDPATLAQHVGTS